MYSLSDYTYHLPRERIAQAPLGKRELSRLFFLDRKTGHTIDHHFYDLADILLPGDTLIINNTEVVPGRLFGEKETGGKAEVLILNYYDGIKKFSNREKIFNCLIKTSKRSRPGTRLIFDRGLTGEVLEVNDEICIVRFVCDENFDQILYQIGKTPLPPYIKGENRIVDDQASYQTIYASTKGAIAAPTAGLHFSKALLEKISEKGVSIVEITLHVGYGTFVPVRVSDIRDHEMHSERFEISKASAKTINRAKKAGKRIVAVGTTCVRTLEFATDENGNILSGDGECNLFIYPGYRFKTVDAMITNFHLPESTLLMLVSAFAGRENIFSAYDQAIERGYRFYSYGDAMFIS